MFFNLIISKINFDFSLVLERDFYNFYGNLEQKLTELKSSSKILDQVQKHSVGTVYF